MARDIDAEEARAALVDHLAARGIDDERVLAAVGEVPRHRFVPDAAVAAAYEDRAMSIGHGATISQPLVVARMLELAELGPDDVVLDVGTGSGYAAAVAARIVHRVVGIEHVEALVDRARGVLDEIDADVEVHVGDGWQGWPADAPYDAIVVAAAAPEVPSALVDQLAPGGRLVLPLTEGRLTTLVRLRREGEDLVRDDHDGVRFVPLVHPDST